jgi:hypothetical protein
VNPDPSRRQTCNQSKSRLARFQAQQWLVAASIGTGMVWLTILHQLTTTTAAIAARLPSDSVAIAPIDELLRLADLPSSFNAMPDVLQQPMKRAISSSVAGYFGSQDISVQNLYTFFDLQNLTIVLGFTLSLPNPKAITQFDADLQGEKALKTFAEAIQKSSYVLGPVQIKKQSIQSDQSLSAFGDVSVRLEVVAEAQSKPLYADMVVFRRGNVGVATVLGSFRRKNEQITVANLAHIQNRRLQ